MGATHTVFQLSQKVPYDFGVETQLLSDVPLDMPTASWRGIYSGQTATVNEIMVDEIARSPAARPGRVPPTEAQLAGARAPFSTGSPRPVSGDEPCPPARPRAWPSTRSTRASSRTWSRSTAATTTPRVTKGVCAVDVGRAVNPRGLEAQMQGALIDGLSMALPPAFTSTTERFARAASPTTEYARMAHAPLLVDVHVMPPTGPPGGAGELGLPAAAAAVANAYARATGTLPTRFPIAFG